MKKKLTWITGLFGLIVLLGGCGTIAKVQKDETANIASIQTYAWAEKNKEQQKGINDLTDRNIKNSINNKLQEMGLREVKSNPDVLVTYDVLLQKEQRVDQNAMYSQPFTNWVYSPFNRRWVPIFYPAQFMGYQQVNRTVNEGTLTISLIDAATDKTIWQGWASDEVNGRKITDKDVQPVVNAIIKKLEKEKAGK
jgi:hypothetical protein